MTELITAIPVYNGERFLGATLDSVARQTRMPDRVVIFDNGSTDRTLEMVRNHPTLRCEVRQNETNLGVLGNANRCLSLAAETRFLHLLMADDILLPDFFKKLIPALSQVEGRGLGYTHNEEINGAGVVIGPRVRRPGGPARQVGMVEFLARQAQAATILLPAVVLKCDYQPPVCLFEDLPQVADGLFLAEWGHRTGNVTEVPEYLCQYRLSDFNASTRHVTQLQYFVRDEWRMMEKIRHWIPEPALARWTRLWKLRCLFGARAEVKRQMFAATKPEYAREIRATSRQTVGPLATLLGVAAVNARDCLWRLRGHATRSDQIRGFQLPSANPAKK